MLDLEKNLEDLQIAFDEFLDDDDQWDNAEWVNEQAKLSACEDMLEK